MNTSSKLLYACLFAAIIIAACDKKEILPGKRQDFFATNTGLNVNKGIATVKVILPNPIVLHNHVSVGGNEQHNAPHHLLSSNQHIAWKTSVGTIASDILCYEGVLLMINASGELVCLDAQTGTLLWKKLVAPQRGRDSFTGGIAISDKTIFITTNYGDIIRIQNGQETWRYNIKLPIRSNPVISHGKVLVIAIDNCAHAFVGKDKIWEKHNDHEEAIMNGAGTPAIYKDKAICAYTNGDVVAMNLGDGTEMWVDTLLPENVSESGSTISHIVASPVVHGDCVLAITAESKMVFSDAASGIRSWEQKLGTVHTPVITSDWCFILDSKNRLMCLSTMDGTIKWATHVETATKHEQLFGPLLINNKVVVFSETGNAKTFNPTDGKINTTNKIDTSIAQMPVIAEKSMFVANHKNEVVCLR